MKAVLSRVSDPLLEGSSHCLLRDSLEQVMNIWAQYTLTEQQGHVVKLMTVLPCVTMCVRIFSLGSTASIEIVAKLSFGNLSTPFTKVESNDTRSMTVNARTKTQQVQKSRFVGRIYKPSVKSNVTCPLCHACQDYARELCMVSWQSTCKNQI